MLHNSVVARRILLMGFVVLCSMREGSVCHRPSALILAIVGLAVGPFARPSMAMPGMAATAASEPATSDDAAMAMLDNMPCCPTKAPFLTVARITLFHGDLRMQIIR